MFKELTYKLQDKLFTIFIYSSYILIIISALGLSQTAPAYLQSLDYYVRIYICLFLIWRFNPLRKKIEFTDLDRKISFTAGLFILTTSALNKYVNYIKTHASSIITKF
jgi:cytochrome c biogenesis protein CcdA